jgi:hypothetical protein
MVLDIATGLVNDANARQYLNPELALTCSFGCHVCHINGKSSASFAKPAV